MATAMTRVLAAAAVAVTAIGPLAAQAGSEADVFARIRDEANRASHIMQSVHVLADVYGPRITGSPALKAAGEWAIRTMESWGLTDGHLEPWTFGYDGWTNERFSAHIVVPVKDSLVGEVLAWTPGTNGTVTAQAFHLKIPDRPTTDQLTAYLNGVRDLVRGRIVLVDPLIAMAVDLNPLHTREDDAAMQRRFGPNPSEPPDRAGARQDRSAEGPLSSGLISRRIDEFLVTNGARVRVDDARRVHGQITAFNNPAYDIRTVIPSVILRHEDYGRIARILAGGTPVEIEVTIVNRTHPEGRTAYNAVAEIAGSDKADEVVLIGGHLDSWQSATGATDNAIGCAVMMEAARILRAIGARPRRTIRVALWSGEEQGLLGSQAYVQQHFGSFENPKPAFGKLMSYLNLDHGTGRPRGAVVFGPASAAAVVRQLVAPFADLGIVGAVESRSRAFGTTDHTAFNNAGLPGVDFELDPIEYESHTHHTNLDTYERILESDARASAVIVAATAYQLAMRDQLLPRFTRADMPPAR
jgi:hypothetical protein